QKLVIIGKTDVATIDAEEISDSDNTGAELNDTEIENLNQVLWYPLCIEVLRNAAKPI
ncbi:9394_t:CDS:1, partial [Paraglomus brasilianum]